MVVLVATLLMAVLLVSGLLIMTGRFAPALNALMDIRRMETLVEAVDAIADDSLPDITVLLRVLLFVVKTPTLLLKEGV